MKAIPTAIPDVLVLESIVHGDHRGYFFECWKESEFNAAVGREIHFLQDNESMSRYGVLRGLHFQKAPYAQSKLVRVVSGRVLDVAVDIRRGSPWFGRHVCCELSGENHRQVFIPRGFAHGFAVLSREAVFQYKCDAPYAPEAEGAIAWDDPALGIDWQLPPSHILLSEKDRHHLPLSQAEGLFDYAIDYYAL